VSSDFWPAGPLSLGGDGGPAMSGPRLRAMHTPARRLLLLATAALVVVACGPAGSATPAASLAVRSPSTSSAPASPSGPSTPEASAAEPSPATRPATSQTDTPWGRIWDALPAGFPRFPGSIPADDAGGDPVTARFAVAGGNAKEIASWFQARLEAATFSTESLSGPLEDGSYVLDSVGDGTCRLQVAIGPLGGMTFVTIRYGAACPNG
jgi:hypothetical protein